MEAIPIPSPPTNLKIISSVCEPHSAQPKAEAQNNKPDTISDAFRPKRSDISPAIITPMIQPTRAELTNQPSIRVDKANCCLTKLMVPEITAVS